ncbi:MAG: hypothetical protein GX786_10445 [Clostridiales bacterium]|nr:hypothetical protein [Clostridiales bacterium]
METKKTTRSFHKGKKCCWKRSSPSGNWELWQGDQKIAYLPTQESWEDTLIPQGEGWLWKRTTDKPVTQMEMVLETCFPADHTMVPSVSYDGNLFGTDHEYKGYDHEGIAYTYASHRIGVPAASASWNSVYSIALCATDGNNNAGSLFPKEKGTTHRVLWPEREEPRVLYARSWEAPFYGEMEPADTFSAYIYVGDACKTAWQKMLHDTWIDQYNPTAKPPLPAKEAWQLAIRYAKQLYTQEDDGLNAFSIGFTWDGTKWIKRKDFKYEIGWCGQNASLAVSLLYHAQMYGDTEAETIGFAVLDSWLEKARSPQGYLLTRYDPEGMPIDAVNLGNAGVQFFEAWKISKLLGKEKSAYFDAAIEICDFALERQRLDGGIGVSWNQDGSLLEPKGTAGAFLLLPLIQAFLETGKEVYNTAAVRGFTYYYNEFHRNGYGTAGALDTYCIDKESIIPILKGGLMMYEATGFAPYLRWAEEAAWYLSTWQWHHTVHYPQDTVLAKMGYDTFGGTAVSTAHHHIDPFALSYVNALLSLSSLTNNPQWESRALAIWNNGLQGISDGSLEIMGKAPRPAGSQDEGYLHTRWGDFGVEGGHFSVSQWLVAWPGAFRMETLRGGVSWNLLDGIGG